MMVEGKIIKYYREKAKLTQKELVKDICSVTHLSKIERGSTEYSSKTMNIVANRLGINMALEIENLNSIKNLLDRWHEMIIKERVQEVESIKEKLEKNPLIEISTYQDLYKLLLARYDLIHNKSERAFGIIMDIQKSNIHVSKYESNLFKHVKGIYYLAKNDFVRAIKELNTVIYEDYNNPEYYYHLAVAYHNTNSQIMSYHYADKALIEFKKTNNFLRVIDTEMLMLVQQQYEQHPNFNDTVRKYEILIETCDFFNENRKKSKLLHNLAFFHFIRKKYEAASDLYKKSCDLKNKTSNEYLLSLEGYIRSSFKAGQLSQEKLLTNINEGLTKAKQGQNELFIILFHLLLYLINNQQELYCNYLTTDGLPFFQKYGYVYLIQRSEKELFDYYDEAGKTDLALEISRLFLAQNK
ncbi:MAG: helix-turn-helix domain-containing protein [Bacillota bacterium]